MPIFIAFSPLAARLSGGTMSDNRAGVKAEARLILSLAWPITLTALNWTAMHLIDVVVVGQYGTDDLAALAASRTVTFIAIVMAISALSGVLVFVARAEGAKRPGETGDVLRSGLLYGAILAAIVLAVLMPRTASLLAAIGVADPLLAPGAAVVRAMALSYPAQFVLVACSFFLEGIARPRRVMTVNLAMLPINALLAWAWVGGHLGFPAWGAVGAALATTVASCLGALMMFYLCWSLPQAPARGVHDWSRAALRRALGRIPALAWFGLMPALGAGLELAGFSWLTALSTQLGSATAGAFQAVLSIHNIGFALCMGLGSAAGVRVGNAVGAGESHAAWSRSLIAGGLTAAILALLSVLLVIFAPQAVWPFSDDAEVQAIAAAMLAAMASFLAFDGFQYVFGSALRSLGEQVWAGINGIIGFFVISGGTGWWLFRQGWGGEGLALALGLGMLAAGLLQFLRLAWVLKLRPMFRRSARTSG
ncbi:MAG: MATE family efflux transporter [Sphingosinicella sp.]